MVFEQEFDLHDLENFGKSDMDIRKLKQSFPDVFNRNKFRPYCEHFWRLLGIENELALRLLHKTQSAKNLGDLNIFLRDFMLDKPKTFEVADRLVNEFGELNAAHQSVVTAREQIKTLTPAREEHRKMESMVLERNALKELQTGIDIYRDTLRMSLLKDHIASLTVEADGLKGEITRQQSLLSNRKDVLWDLERLRRRDQTAAACRELGWTLSETPHGFAELVGEAREELEGLDNRNKSAQNELLILDRNKNETESAFLNTRKEIEALHRQPSNIPAAMLDLRNKIASGIGISDAALPFAGELIEVKPDESSWQGAIERVLRGFALSILVDERNYPALSNYINGVRFTDIVSIF